jgi:hypothetical protein
MGAANLSTSLARLPSDRGFARGALITSLCMVYGAWVVVGFFQADSISGLAMACVVLSLFLSTFILASQDFDPLSPTAMLLLFAQVYFAARFSLADHRFGDWHGFVFLCYTLFLLGVLLVVHVRLFSVNMVRVLVRRSRVAARGRIMSITCLTLFAYMAIVLYLLRATNDSLEPLSLLLASLATRLAIAEQGLSPFLLLSGFLSTIGITGAFVLAQHYKVKSMLLLWLLVLAGAAMALGSRGQIIIPLFQLILAAAVCTRNYIKLLMWLAPPLVAFTVAFSTWFLAMREGGGGAPDDYSIFDRFDAYRNWLEGLHDGGIQFSFGESVWSAAAQFVPRSMFPEKPYYFSTEMTRRFFSGAFDLGINLDFGGIAESVYNFHILGPFVFGIFIGWMCRMLYQLRKLARESSSPVLAVVYAQGLMLPASFFFVGWINSNLIFIASGYVFLSLLSVRLFCMPNRSTPQH